MIEAIITTMPKLYLACNGRFQKKPTVTARRKP